jgi:hypothetical protein
VNSVFQSIYNELETQRAEILNQVKVLSLEKFNYSPSPEKWSISQILTHILVAEQLSVGYMKKKALGIEQLKDSGVVELFILEMLKASQRIPAIKFNAPKVVLTHTPPAFAIDELISRWQAHRADLKKFIESIEDKNVKKLLYKHPIAGRLDARQAMVFFREHIIHHLPQIKRLLD